MSEELVDLDAAKRHLGLTETSRDEDLQLKLDIAHELILDRVKQRRSDAATWEATVEAWTEDTAPAKVKGAILVQFGELCRVRGDDDPPAATRPTSLHPLAEGYIQSLFDPAFS